MVSDVLVMDVDSMILWFDLVGVIVVCCWVKGNLL